MVEAGVKYWDSGCSFSSLQGQAMSAIIVVTSEQAARQLGKEKA